MSVCVLATGHRNGHTDTGAYFLNIVFRTISTKDFFQLFKDFIFDRFMAFSGILGRFGVNRVFFSFKKTQVTSFDPGI